MNVLPPSVVSMHEAGARRRTSDTQSDGADPAGDVVRRVGSISVHVLPPSSERSMRSPTMRHRRRDQRRDLERREPARSSSAARRRAAPACCRRGVARRRTCVRGCSFLREPRPSAMLRFALLSRRCRAALWRALERDRGERHSRSAACRARQRALPAAARRAAAAALLSASRPIAAAPRRPVAVPAQPSTTSRRSRPPLSAPATTSTKTRCLGAWGA